MKKTALFTTIGLLGTYKYIMFATKPDREKFDRMHSVNQFRDFSSYLSTTYSNQHIIDLNENKLKESSFFYRIFLYRDINYIRKKFKKLKMAQVLK